MRPTNPPTAPPTMGPTLTPLDLPLVPSPCMVAFGTLVVIMEVEGGRVVVTVNGVCVT